MPEGSSPKGSLLERFIPVLIAAIIGLSFVVGIMWQKITKLEKGTASVAGTGNTQQTGPQISLDTIKGLFSKDLLKFGDGERKLLFVEVADPSCPFCHAVAGKNPELSRELDPNGNTFKLVSDGGGYTPPVPEMKKLVDSGKASYIYIYTPGHGNGEMGMKALYCAYEQDKFWEAHDALMTNKGYTFLNETVKNDKTQSQKVADYFKGVLDTTKLKECLDNGKYDARLTSDTQLAQSLGITGTPGFFINTTNFAGAYSYEQMKSVVDAALK